jgi:hypothetical protein
MYEKLATQLYYYHCPAKRHRRKGIRNWVRSHRGARDRLSNEKRRLDGYVQ